jgi:hypothetical protein
MAFKMTFNKEEMKGMTPVPAGLYEVRFAGFNPKISEKKDSVNFNISGEIIGHPEFEGRKVFANLNTKIPGFIQDAVHSFGLEMHQTGPEEYAIPGQFDADKGKFKEDDPSTWTYAGPLTGKTAKWEVGEDEYQGKKKNVVRAFLCKVPTCAEKFPDISHSSDMARKKS